jgi:hypothetical protein
MKGDASCVCVSVCVCVCVRESALVAMKGEQSVCACECV